MEQLSDGLSVHRRGVGASQHRGGRGGEGNKGTEEMDIGWRAEGWMDGERSSGLEWVGWLLVGRQGGDEEAKRDSGTID